MPEHSWREIPMEDMGPMLRDCSDEPLWQHLWEALPNSIAVTDGRALPAPKALVVYLMMVCISASSEGRFPLDDLIQSSAAEAIFRNTYQTGCKRFLAFIVPFTRDDDQDVEQCYTQIKSFVRLNAGEHLTLGELLDRLMEQNRLLLSREEQRDLAPALGLLTPRLDHGELYQLWIGWLDRKIRAIPAAQRVRDRLEHGVKQVVLNGAPGTGKTYIAKLLAQRLGARLPGEPVSYTQVQFHPSYDYTDFLEGLRPIQRDGGICYVKLDGHFKRFCRRVVEEGDPDEQYYFLIDEINRADLSKVFGELMYCLEADKRGPGNGVLTQYQNLPTYDLERGRELTAEEDVFAKGFYLPKNVYILGTMNDIDRSVESMDFALRRRFEFQEITVDEELLRPALRQMGFGENTEALAGSVAALNRAIAEYGKKYGLNRQYFISQGQFANLPAVPAGDLEAVKTDAWELRIEPLLQEYLRGEEDSGEFLSHCKHAFGLAADAAGGEP